MNETEIRKNGPSFRYLPIIYESTMIFEVSYEMREFSNHRFRLDDGKVPDQVASI